MIVKLNEDHREALMALLNREPDYNLYIIGDIENYGFDANFQEVWGNVEDEVITSVLLRYHVFFMYYSPVDEDVSGYVTIMTQHESFEILSGKVECVRRFMPIIQWKKLRELYLAKLDENEFQTTADTSNVQTATLKDMPQVLELYGKIEEFTDASVDLERLELPLRTKTGRTLLLRGSPKRGRKSTGEEGLITCVSTTAETSDTAILVGLMTDPAHRKMGYGTQCLQRLCFDLIREGKQVYLTYDNPDAGRIYRRIGFREVGRWAMAETK